MATLVSPQYGQTTVGTSAVVLTVDTVQVNYGVMIMALGGNTVGEYVYVGLTGGVTAATGWQLAPGKEMLVSRAEAAMAGSIYVIASAASQGVCWRAI